jgi:hypothetical protein
MLRMSGISSGKKWDHPKLIQNFVSSATGLLVAADVLSLRVPLGARSPSVLSGATYHSPIGK